MPIGLTATPSWESAPEQWSSSPSPPRAAAPAKQPNDPLGTLRSTDPLPPVEDLLSWIASGPPPPSQDPLEAARPRKRSMTGSTSLPALSSGPMRRSISRSQAEVHQKGASLRRAGQAAWLVSMPLPTDNSLAVLARTQQIRQAVHDHLALGRVPTPQHAAKRTLPSLPLHPPVLTDEQPPSYGWQPPGAAARLGDAYIFHEPGERLRRNLSILATWRHQEAHLERIERARSRRSAFG